MARTFLTLCVTIVIVSPYVNPYYIKDTEHTSFPMEALDAFAMQNQGKKFLDQVRIGQGPSQKAADQADLGNDDNRPKILKSCESSTYCEEALNYPQEAIDKLIPKLEKVDILRMKQIESLDEPDFFQRTNVSPHYIQLCDAPEQVVYPRYGVDRNGTGHFLVNPDFQGFRVQACKESDCKCHKMVEVFPNGYRGRCKQFYYYRPAMAFTKNGDDVKTVYTIDVKVPSNCGCVAEVCTNYPEDSGPNMPLCDIHV